MTYLNFVILIVVSIFAYCCAFPDGAPIDVCVKPQPNTPNHGQAKSQPPETNPYNFVASSDQYSHGSEISVTIQGRVPFKGFFIQARDVATNQWIGEFVKTPNTNVHPECSSITHADPKEKQQATLIWKAPTNLPGGKVYFTGTILKDYHTFWSGLVGNVGQH